MKKLLLALGVIVLVSACKGTIGATDKNKGKLFLRTLTWTGSYGSSLDISWLYLDSEGNIVQNPRHGVNPIDIQAEKLDNETAGTYKIEGEILKVTWLNGKTEDWKLEMNNGEYGAINGGIVSQPEAMPANYRLSGKFSAGEVLPNVSASSTISFGNDGKFTVSNFGAIATANISGSSSATNHGTYMVNGNTLKLIFGNGRTEISPICQWNINGKRYLIIGTSSYPEEK